MLSLKPCFLITCMKSGHFLVGISTTAMAEIHKQIPFTPYRVRLELPLIAVSSESLIRQRVASSSLNQPLFPICLFPLTNALARMAFLKTMEASSLVSTPPPSDSSGLRALNRALFYSMTIDIMIWSNEETSCFINYCSICSFNFCVFDPPYWDISKISFTSFSFSFPVYSCILEFPKFFSS